MNQIRLSRMKAYIEKKNAVTIKELQTLFPEVSLMTIHRDLDTLVEEGAIVKFRGGAKSVVHNGDPEFNVRIGENNSGKFVIAQKLCFPGCKYYQSDAGKESAGYQSEYCHHRPQYCFGALPAAQSGSNPVLWYN